MKCTSYFAEDLKIEYSEDEQKYFQVARQGSHEKAARVHRGKVVKDILENSIDKQLEMPDTLQKNTEYLETISLNSVTISPTKTALTKSILDATSDIRKFLTLTDLHKYDEQGKGPENKVSLDCFIYHEAEDTFKESEMSLYKSQARGDTRFSVSDLNAVVDAGDTLIIQALQVNLWVNSGSGKFPSV